MLIRSQDRTRLFNLERIALTAVQEEGKWWIVGLAPDVGEAWVTRAGEYSTEAKALKVLDDIEDMYIQEAKHTTSCVLYMPLDDEVEDGESGEPQAGTD